MSKVTTTAAPAAYVDDSTTFDSFDLDPRLLQAINQLGFKNPTLIQSSSIPLALQEKRDIIAKASTGSGKTAAYCIPIIQNILSDADVDTHEIKSIILVPTRELSNQVYKFLEKLVIYCNSKINLVNLSSNLSDQVINSLLLNKPEILISTPSKLVQILEKTNNSNLINLKTVKNLTIDEVDLILSYGHLEDLDKLETYLPIKKNLQTFLMSATINEELNNLKTKFCSKPAILNLIEENAANDKLVQYYVKVSEFDKFLLTFVIFKLSLIKGKTIIFVNSIDRGYRLKLFMEQFGIKSCILNSELPINSRLHIVEEFNKNVYQLLIATDETNEFVFERDEEEEKLAEKKESKLENVEESVVAEEVKAEEEEEEETEVKNEAKEEKSVKLKKQKNKSDKEYGVSRGVDFQNVACVLNFDLPLTSKAYIHRIGRTARAGKSGMALSFVIPENEFGKHKVATLKSSKRDEKILQRIIKQQLKTGFEIKPYKFDMNQVEGFRYRSEDAFRSVTQVSIREARIKELKNELINSNKLKRHFSENPQDLVSLRHDKELHPTRIQTHLKRIPNYLLPEGARADNKKVGFVAFNKHRINKSKSKKKRNNKNDPLKSFKSKK